MDPVIAVALLLGAIMVFHLVSSYGRRLFGGDAEESESPSRTTPARSDVGPKRPEAGPDQRVDPSTVVCPSCGVENDREYTYCRDCVAHLAAIDER